MGWRRNWVWGVGFGLVFGLQGCMPISFDRPLPDGVQDMERIPEEFQGLYVRDDVWLKFWGLGLGSDALYLAAQLLPGILVVKDRELDLLFVGHATRYVLSGWNGRCGSGGRVFLRRWQQDWYVMNFEERNKEGQCVYIPWLVQFRGRDTLYVAVVYLEMKKVSMDLGSEGGEEWLLTMVREQAGDQLEVLGTLDTSVMGGCVQPPVLWVSSGLREERREEIEECPYMAVRLKPSSSVLPYFAQKAVEVRREVQGVLVRAWRDRFTDVLKAMHEDQALLPEVLQEDYQRLLVIARKYDISLSAEEEMDREVGESEGETVNLMVAVLRYLRIRE